MADAIHRLGSLKVSPRTTFNVGVVTGGTSVNSIPVEMSMDVDLRSESRAELDKVSLAFATMVRDAAEAENKTRSTAQGRLTADACSSATALQERRHRVALHPEVAAAMKAFGMKPNYDSKQDTDIPISRNIPAGTSVMGASGAGTPLDEWTDVETDIVGERRSARSGDHRVSRDGLTTPSTTRLEGSRPARRLAPPSSRGAGTTLSRRGLRFRTGCIPLVRLTSGDVINARDRRRRGAKQHRSSARLHQRDGVIDESVRWFSPETSVTLQSSDMGNTFRPGRGSLSCGRLPDAVVRDDTHGRAPAVHP